MDQQFPQQESLKRSPASGRLPWLAVLLVLLVVFLLLPSLVERIVYAVVRGRERAQVDTARGELPTPGLKEISRQFALVAKAIGPSVVHIDALQTVGGRGDFASLRFPGYEAMGQGSGVIVDEAGYILTNNHVVANARTINVKLSGNETRTAEVVGLDETTDLAVIKIPSGGLIAAEWGDSDALEVGALVWAVGNPFGLDRSVTFGIVSAKNRRVLSVRSPYQDFLQTDAAVNPGNSGGPLVDVTGKIVGINTAIVGRGYQGISFSIPASIAHEVYQQLREAGTVVRGYMGVGLADITPEVAKELGLESLNGALVLQVGPDTPAAKAGIKPGDVVAEWDGQKIGDRTELTLLVGKTKIGTRVKMKVIRAGEPLELELTVEARPAEVGP
jgi:S1-C subfamily serine protease